MAVRVEREAACARCDLSRADDDAPDSAARVVLYAPAPLAMAKVGPALSTAGYRVESSNPVVAIVQGPSTGWTALLQALEARLSPIEAAEVRIAPIGELPADSLGLASAAIQARPLSALLAESRDAWLTDALREGRLTSHFQPIVDVVAGEVFAHEGLLRVRGRDGSTIGAAQALEAGRRLDILHVLDQLGRAAAIESAHRLGMTSKLFINFFPTVVYDPIHCLRSTRQAMKSTGLRPDQIVFEVVESEQIADRSYLLEILSRYRAEGFGVALDDLGSGYSSLNLLAALHPDYVKLDIELVREADRDPLRAGLVRAITDAARDAVIAVIAEGVERRETAELLAGLGIRLMQGYFFGRPTDALGRPPTLSQPATIG